jgi:hypothetical protein
MIEPLHEVLVRLAAPVAADRIAERLTEPVLPWKLISIVT